MLAGRMDVGRFYATQNLTKKLTTLHETIEAVVESNSVTSVVVLPPDAGDSAADSDIENVPDELENELPYEPAGEFQLEEIDCENEEDIEVQINEKAKPGQKRKHVTKSAWKRSANFRTEIPFEAKPELSSLFPMLKGLQPFDLRQLMFDKVTLDNLLEQTKLYAVRDKSSPEFVVESHEMLRFLGILILSGYHALPEEVHYWSNQPDLGV